MTGDNEYKMARPSGSEPELELEGDVDGSSLCVDLWLRYDLGAALSLPFLVSGEYRKVERGGDLKEVPRITLEIYEHTATQLAFQLSGGLHKEYSESTGLGGGPLLRI